MREREREREKREKRIVYNVEDADEFSTHS